MDLVLIGIASFRIALTGRATASGKLAGSTKFIFSSPAPVLPNSGLTLLVQDIRNSLTIVE